MFADWDYAVHVWKTLPTGEDFDREYERVNPAYEEWKKANGSPDISVLTALEGPNADVIRQGHDLERVYTLWKEIYQIWRRGRGGPHKAEPWNKSSGSMTCFAIQVANPFTGQCNDLPDWRTSDDVAYDDKVLAEYRARQARKAAAD